jgi:hypothetical protein
MIYYKQIFSELYQTRTPIPHLRKEKLLIVLALVFRALDTFLFFSILILIR